MSRGGGPRETDEAIRPGLSVPVEIVELIVSRTKGVSAAFIKELMRRYAQFQIEFSCGGVLTQKAADAAIEEMLFVGETLNGRLLGGERAEPILDETTRLLS